MTAGSERPTFKDRQAVVNLLLESICQILKQPDTKLPPQSINLLLIVTNAAETFAWSLHFHDKSFRYIANYTPQNSSNIRQVEGEKVISVQIDYATLEGLLANEISIPNALLTRKVKYSGSIQELRHYRDILDRAGEIAAKEVLALVGANQIIITDNEKSAIEKFVKGKKATAKEKTLIFVDANSEKWENENIVSSCRLCNKSFGFFSNRKHHCRVCGLIMCQECSGNIVAGNRVCDRCYLAIKTTTSLEVDSQEKKLDLEAVKASKEHEIPEFEHERFVQRLFSSQNVPILVRTVNNITGPLVTFGLSLLSEVKSLTKRVQNIEKSTSLFGGILSTLKYALNKMWFILPSFLAWSIFVTPKVAVLYPKTAQIGLCFLIITAKRWPASLFSLGLSLTAAAIASPTATLQTSLLIAKPLTEILGRNMLQFLLSQSIYLGYPSLAISFILYLGTIFFGRVLHIYSVALSIIFSYLTVKIIFTDVLKWSDKRTESIYMRLHYIMAPYACDQIIQLRSVFVKFGQYLGGRADMVPPEWNTILAKLQDDMPADREGYVRSTIAKSFGAQFEEVFYEFDIKPLASASVAQVHQAYLRTNTSERGQKVAVKVQHEHIKDIMQDDMIAFKRIVHFIGWLNPRFGAVSTVLGAWEKEMLKELDFHVEADNIRLVAKNLSSMGFIAPESDSNSFILMPKVIDGLVATNAFAMSFVEGFKLTDNRLLRLYQVDLQALMERIVQVYAVQMFVDGVFNADPHPGNILVHIDNSDTATAKPVLLDFGMVVTLPEKERLGYCKLIYSISQLSINGVSEAIAEIGYQNSQSHLYPERDLEYFAFMLRPTAGRAKSQVAANAFQKRRKAQRKNDITQRDESKSKAKKDGEDLETDKSIDEGRYFKSFPESLIFLFRVLGLIRGLCANLEVEVNYLGIMGEYARLALLRHREKIISQLQPSPDSSLVDIDVQVHNMSSLEGNTRTFSVVSDLDASSIGSTLTSNLSRKLRLLAYKFEKVSKDLRTYILKDLQSDVPSLVAIDIYACLEGKELLNVRDGRLGLLDKRSVSAETLFPLGDMSAMFLTCAVLALASDLKVRFEDTISSIWKEFPLKDLTLMEVLNKSSKLPEVISLTPSAIYLKETNLVWEQMLLALKQQSNDLKPDDTAKTTVHTGPFVLMKIIELVSGMPCQQYLETLIKQTMQTSPESFDILLTREKDRTYADASVSYARFIIDMVSSSMFERDIDAASEAGDNNVAPRFDAARLSGIPLDPAIVNSTTFEEGFIPSMGIYGSSKALSLFLYSFLKRKLSKKILLQMLKDSVFDSNRTIENTFAFGVIRRSYGFQVWNLDDSEDVDAKLLLVQGWGGNFVLIHPAKSLFVSILVNHMSIDREATKRVVASVLEACELKTASLEKLFAGPNFMSL